MKLLLFVTFFSIALANFLDFHAFDLAKTVSVSAPSSITDYFTAHFAYFGLKQPNQILNCFDEKSTALFFKHIYEVANLVQDQEHRERIHVHLDLIKLIVLDKALVPLKGCIEQTQDFTDLLNALGIKERNPDLGWLYKYIYIQANFGKLAGELPQVTGALNNKNYKSAGELNAAIVNDTTNDFRTQGIALIALNGLWNGVRIALGLPDAQSIYPCWNNDTATIRLEFIYGLAAAVGSGSPKDAFNNTKNWYQQTGNALIGKIPKSAWQCWANSTDTQSESQALKIDITTQAFYSKVSNFAENHQLAYWGLQKGIKSSLENHNFLHAGSSYGHLLQAAVKTSKSWNH